MNRSVAQKAQMDVAELTADQSFRLAD